jgi:CarD family transcriptional regulator
MSNRAHFAQMCYTSNMAKPKKLWFSDGDVIVYPGYGVGVVLGVQERVLNNAPRKFCVISFREAGNESKVMVPLDNVEEVGLRPISSRKRVDEALAFLASGEPDILASWKDRFSAHGDLLSSGDLLSVATVLKALWILNTKKPLSFREKKMYQKALLLMASEVGVVQNRPRADVESDLLERLTQSQAS